MRNLGPTWKRVAVSLRSLSGVESESVTSLRPERTKRRLRIEPLRQRRLFAGDTAYGPMLHYTGGATIPAETMAPEDVNQDGIVSPLDALLIINATEDSAQADDFPQFMNGR